MQMQRWGVSKMVYNVLFHWHERRISQVSFSNLSQFTKTGYELIRQVNATARQKWWKRNKVWFLFCPNNLVKLLKKIINNCKNKLSSETNMPDRRQTCLIGDPCRPTFLIADSSETDMPNQISTCLIRDRHKC